MQPRVTSEVWIHLGQLQKIPQIFLTLFFGVELIASEELKFIHLSIYLTNIYNGLVKLQVQTL